MVMAGCTVPLLPANCRTKSNSYWAHMKIMTSQTSKRINRAISMLWFALPYSPSRNLYIFSISCAAFCFASRLHLAMRRCLRDLDFRNDTAATFITSIPNCTIRLTNYHSHYKRKKTLDQYQPSRFCQASQKLGRSGRNRMESEFNKSSI